MSTGKTNPTYAYSRTAPDSGKGSHSARHIEKLYLNKSGKMQQFSNWSIDTKNCVNHHTSEGVTKHSSDLQSGTCLK